MAQATTLWGSVTTDDAVFQYTVGDDREWDARLLRWDVLGSLGHIEGLRAARLITPGEHATLQTALRQILAAVMEHRLLLDHRHEDAHTAVEFWLTARAPGAGEHLHTGRSRNDQVACDLRLFLKDELLKLLGLTLDLSTALLAFARRHHRVLWPGYTHGRRAMPSSLGLWAGAYAEGLVDTSETFPALWGQVDRSPLGSAAGYGVPLPLQRTLVAKVLGFGGIDVNVATVQGGRGKLEAAVLFWCTQVGHEIARLAQDIILFSGEEFGYLTLPPELATGSSIMPHKRNPDVFELTRARAAAVEGDLMTVLQIKSKLSGGYHRDFQLLKEPLMRGIERTAAMVQSLAMAIPRLGIDPARCREALAGGALATDEVMRRVEGGRPFRLAYREVAAALSQGQSFQRDSDAAIIARRQSTGGLGNLGLSALKSRVRSLYQWSRPERQRFERAMSRLAGTAPLHRPESRAQQRP